MAELPTAEAERRAILEKELEAIKYKHDNLLQAFEEQKAKIAEAYQALEDFKPEFTPEQAEQAQEALARGDTQAAETLFQQALDKGVEESAEAAYQLGVLAESQIDYLKAKEYYAKALQLQADNPLYLNALGNLQRTLGLYQKAQLHLEEARKIRETALGPDHPNVAANLNNLAALYETQGKYAEAEPLYHRALKIDEKALGPDHPDVATDLENYAVLLRKTGREAEATPLEARVRAIREKHRSSK